MQSREPTKFLDGGTRVGEKDGGREGGGVRAKPWPGLLLLRYADGNIKDCHLPGFIHIRIHINIYCIQDCT